MRLWIVQAESKEGRESINIISEETLDEIGVDPTELNENTPALRDFVMISDTITAVVEIHAPANNCLPIDKRMVSEW